MQCSLQRFDIVAELVIARSRRGGLPLTRAEAERLLHRLQRGEGGVPDDLGRLARRELLDAGLIEET